MDSQQGKQKCQRMRGQTLSVIGGEDKREMHDKGWGESPHYSSCRWKRPEAQQFLPSCSPLPKTTVTSQGAGPPTDQASCRAFLLPLGICHPWHHSASPMPATGPDWSPPLQTAPSISRPSRPWSWARAWGTGSHGCGSTGAAVVLVG